jgi:heptosyltransferase-2
MQFFRSIRCKFSQRIKTQTLYLSKEKEIFRKKKTLNNGVNLEQLLIMCGVLGTNEKLIPIYMASVLTYSFLIEQAPTAQILFNYHPGKKNEAKKIYMQCNPKTKSQILLNIYEKFTKRILFLTQLTAIFILAMKEA